MALWSLPGIFSEYAGGVRWWEVGQLHSTCEACEQGFRCAVIRGVGGGKGAGQGEYVFAKQVPDTEPGKGTVWTILNGHVAGNRGHSQGLLPAAVHLTCKVRVNVYDRRPPFPEQRLCVIT